MGGFGELTSIDLEYPLTPPCAALAQIASIGGIADQRLLAAPQCILQSCDDRLTVAAILFGFRLIAADDVAPTLDRYLLDKELGLTSLSLDQQRYKRILILQHDSLGNRIGALACPEDILKSAFLQPSNGSGRDHAAIGNDTRATNGETLTQAVEKYT